jgi:glycosyltransferase involved in cell wall biosynthesis
MSGAGFPRISVFIPNYNHAAYLPAALESVCAQDPPPFEVFVFDDCSTDNSCDIVESFRRRYPFLHLVRYPAKSRDWVEATAQHLPQLGGDYVLGLGADDVLFPGCLRVLAEFIRQYPQAGVVFGNYKLLNDHQEPIGEKCSGVRQATFLTGPDLAGRLCKSTLFESGIAAVVRRDALAWLLQNDSYRMGPYVDLVGYSVAALRYGAGYVPAFLSGFRIGHSTDTYCQAAVRDQQAFWGLVKNVRAFLQAPDVAAHVPRAVAVALEKKVIATLPPGGSVAVRVLGWLLPLQNSRSPLARGLFRALVTPLKLAARCVLPGVLWYRQWREAARTE